LDRIKAVEAHLLWCAQWQTKMGGGTQPDLEWLQNPAHSELERWLLEMPCSVQRARPEYRVLREELRRFRLLVCLQAMQASGGDGAQHLLQERALQRASACVLFAIAKFFRGQGKTA